MSFINVIVCHDAGRALIIYWQIGFNVFEQMISSVSHLENDQSELRKV